MSDQSKPIKLRRRVTFYYSGTMFNKFTVFAALAVAMLVASAYGHPTAEAEENGGESEETTVRNGMHIRMTSKKFPNHAKDCYKHGKDIFAWMKKFGLLKTTTTTTTEAVPPSKTVTKEPVKATDYEIPDSEIGGGGETSSEVEETPEAGDQIEPVVSGGGGDSVEAPYPIAETLSEFSDQPTIDVRSTF